MTYKISVYKNIIYNQPSLNDFCTQTTVYEVFLGDYFIGSGRKSVQSCICRCLGLLLDINEDRDEYIQHLQELRLLIESERYFSDEVKENYCRNEFLWLKHNMDIVIVTPSGSTTKLKEYLEDLRPDLKSLFAQD